MGFSCKTCGANTFALKVQPSVTQQLHITTNEFNDVLITVGQNPPFQADLGFMNRFASCTQCGAIKQWQYQAVTNTINNPATPKNTTILEVKSPASSKTKKTAKAKLSPSNPAT